MSTTTRALGTAQEGTEGENLNKQQQQENIAARAGDQAPKPHPDFYSFDPEVEIWRGAWCQGINTMYELVRDHLPPDVRAAIAKWRHDELWPSQEGYTHDFPVPPNLKTRGKK